MAVPTVAASVTNYMRRELVKAHRETGGSQLSSGKPKEDTEDDDTELLGSSWPSQPEKGDSDKLTIEVNRWLSLGRPAPALTWAHGQEPVVTTRSEALFGVLAWQLTTAVARSRSLWLACNGCSEMFVPTHGRQRYCSECQTRGVPARDRKRRQHTASC